MALGDGGVKPSCLPRVYRLLHFVEVFEDDFPLVVQIYSGFCGLNECEAISTGQIFQLARTVVQKRVFTRDNRGVVYSLPLNTSLPMKIISSRINEGFLTLRQIVAKYPHLKLKVMIGEDADADAEAEHLIRPNTVLLLMQAYEEHFIEANCISNGTIHNFPTYLPLYASVQVQIVYGMKKDKLPSEAEQESNDKNTDRVVWENLRISWEDQIQKNSLQRDFLLNKAILMYDHKNGFSHPMFKGKLLDSLPPTDEPCSLSTADASRLAKPKKSSLKKRISTSLTRDFSSRQFNWPKRNQETVSSANGSCLSSKVSQDSSIFGSPTRVRNKSTEQSAEVESGNGPVANNGRCFLNNNSVCNGRIDFERNGPTDIEKKSISSLNADLNNLTLAANSDREKRRICGLTVAENSSFGVYIENSDTYLFDTRTAREPQPLDNASQFTDEAERNLSNGAFSNDVHLINLNNIHNTKVSNGRLVNYAINGDRKSAVITTIAYSGSIVNERLNKVVAIEKMHMKPSKRTVSYSDTDTIFPIERYDSSSTSTSNSKFFNFPSNKQRRPRPLRRISARYSKDKNASNDNQSINSREIERIESGFSRTIGKKESITFLDLLDQQQSEQGSNGSFLNPAQPALIATRTSGQKISNGFTVENGKSDERKNSSNDNNGKIRFTSQPPRSRAENIFSESYSTNFNETDDWSTNNPVASRRSRSAIRSNQPSIETVPAPTSRPPPSVKYLNSVSHNKANIIASPAILAQI